MASKYAVTFSENLKTLMAEQKLSNSELARRTGISNQAISHYLLCQREITLENLCKIADYFNEDIDVLIGRKDY